MSEDAVVLRVREGDVSLDVDLKRDAGGLVSGRAVCLVGEWRCGSRVESLRQESVPEFLVSIRLYLDRLLRGTLPESEKAPVLSSAQRDGVELAMGVLP